jgi:rod shape-determining protein MreD
MIAAYLGYTILGFCLFYFQNLVLFPHVHLWLLSLMLFYLGMRPSLGLALALALTLGALQDSFAATPFGVHLAGSLVLVAVARFFRPRLLGPRLGSQMVASLVALTLQEVIMQILLLILGYEELSVTSLLARYGLEILGTAALGPLMYLTVRGMENFLRRYGWRPGSESSAYQTFS